LEIGNWKFLGDLYREPIDDKSSPGQKQENLIVPEAPKLPEKPADQPAASSIQNVASSAPAPVQTGSTPAAQPSSNDSKILEKDRQLKILVDMAFAEGIDKAVEAAKATNSAYLIDELHDMLVDKLRQELIEKGKLKEV